MFEVRAIIHNSQTQQNQFVLSLLATGVEIMTYKILDLGCRSGSAVAAWQAAGHTVVGVDWEPHGQQLIMDYTKDETWDVIDNVTEPWNYIVKPYDFIWFSPDCSIFSLMNMRWDRNFDDNYNPISEQAIREVEGIKYVLRQIKLRSPSLGWIMENPRALMRKMDFVKDLHRATVTYCQYGDTRQKPTDLFGNIPMLFRPRMCRAGSSCHESARRGSQGGTQGMDDKTAKGLIPYQLSREIMWAAIKSEGKTIPTLGDWI
jgi:hypothetical protein